MSDTIGPTSVLPKGTGLLTYPSCRPVARRTRRLLARSPGSRRSRPRRPSCRRRPRSSGSRVEGMARGSWEPEIAKKLSAFSSHHCGDWSNEAPTTGVSEAWVARSARAPASESVTGRTASTSSCWTSCCAAASAPYAEPVASPATTSHSVSAHVAPAAWQAWSRAADGRPWRPSATTVADGRRIRCITSEQQDSRNPCNGFTL
jgi:hypothetical protein